ncbi:hypothetical protein OEZ85_000396 [Tetradesmus obliquus]|uniref:WSC domain-containing protein n=1 Tax=Tetradesmus obliquus TaxID=3088 RepID=A0ABY8UQ63_TETOB|nr:hypothetical protein OEZ85_000396 [Tetradesmus obliquus]
MKGPWLLAVLCALLHAVGSNATGDAADAAGLDAAGLDAALARGQVQAAAPAALNQSSVSANVVGFAAADAVLAGPATTQHDGTLFRILLDAGGCANAALSNLGVNLPNNARWSAANGCSNTAQTSGLGVACTAECDAGFVAYGGGFSATCVAGSGGATWSTTDTSLACSDCSGTPAAAGHSLPANAAWGCVGTTTGIGNPILYQHKSQAPKGSPTPPGWPEGLNTTTANGVITIEFNVAARCACSSAFFGVVESAQYRNLPAAACGR